MIPSRAAKWSGWFDSLGGLEESNRLYRRNILKGTDAREDTVNAGMLSDCQNFLRGR